MPGSGGGRAQEGTRRWQAAAQTRATGRLWIEATGLPTADGLRCDDAWGPVTGETKRGRAAVASGVDWEAKKRRTIKNDLRGLAATVVEREGARPGEGSGRPSGLADGEDSQDGRGRAGRFAPSKGGPRRGESAKSVDPASKNRLGNKTCRCGHAADAQGERGVQVQMQMAGEHRGGGGATMYMMRSRWGMPQSRQSTGARRVCVCLSWMHRGVPWSCASSKPNLFSAPPPLPAASLMSPTINCSTHATLTTASPISLLSTSQSAMATTSPRSTVVHAGPPAAVPVSAFIARIAP